RVWRPTIAKWLTMWQRALSCGDIAENRAVALLLCTARVVSDGRGDAGDRPMLHQAERGDTAAKLVALAREAARAGEALLAEATAAVRRRVTLEGQLNVGSFDREQRATHGLAWIATYVEAVRQLAGYAGRMHDRGALGEIEELLVRIGLGEYLAQIQGGIPMSQGEIVRPADLGLAPAAVAARLAPVLRGLASGGDAERRARLVELMRGHHGTTVGDCGLDETLTTIRGEMRKFADSEVVPYAQAWHRSNSYI